MAQAQRLYARDLPDLQHNKLMTSEGMKGVSDLDRSQRLTGPMYSSPSPQGDRHPPEETTAFPVPALALPRRQHQGGRRGCVLRSRQMVLREPPGIDARLPAGLVLWEAGIARHPMGRTQHQRTGVRAIAIATLTDRSKELDARPARPVL